MSQPADITLDQYERMLEAGVFEGFDGERIELRRGRICRMSPIGSEYASVLTNVVDWSYETTPRYKVTIRVQCPIRLPRAKSAPEPDLVWLTKKSYPRHPLPDDVVLLVEVSDTTLADDLGEKLKLYASDGIAEYWVVDIPGKVVRVHRQPERKTYTDVAIYRDGEEIRPAHYATIDPLTPTWAFETI